MDVWYEIWKAYNKTESMRSYFKEIFTNNNDDKYLFWYIMSLIFSLMFFVCMIVFKENTLIFIVLFGSSVFASTIFLKKLKESRFRYEKSNNQYDNLNKQYWQLQMGSRMQLFFNEIDKLKISDLSRYIEICKEEIDFQANRFFYYKLFLNLFITVIITLFVWEFKSSGFFEMHMILKIFLIFTGVLLFTLFVAFPISLIKTYSEKLRELKLFLTIYQFEYLTNESTPVLRRIKRNMLK